MKNKIIAYVVTVLVVILLGFFGYNLTNKQIGNIQSSIENTVSDETTEINQSTTEIPELTENDEQSVEVQETESEGFEEQGQIAYNGSEKAPNVSTGDYAGLTYYSQIDSR